MRSSPRRARPTTKSRNNIDGKSSRCATTKARKSSVTNRAMLQTTRRAGHGTIPRLLPHGCRTVAVLPVSFDTDWACALGMIDRCRHAQRLRCTSRGSRTIAWCKASRSVRYRGRGTDGKPGGCGFLEPTRASPVARAASVYAPRGPAQKTCSDPNGTALREKPCEIEGFGYEPLRHSLPEVLGILLTSDES